MDETRVVDVAVGVRGGAVVARYYEGVQGGSLSEYRPSYEYWAEVLDEDMCPEIEGLALDLFEKGARPYFSDLEDPGARPLTDDEMKFLKLRCAYYSEFS